ncbi:hypothetical protein [Mesoterricola sediminis]|uniref:Uncharacterized protein n=1 Tax=Mesoterricola sediminis TaxID=2927980 RepID=A0AA48HBW5_9BACT|nr:hypothetical protein [Mesoterricola sediminis]BDU75453.1 hypothetical protein METESE_04110 [Mesoterricola sediminis]
MRLGILVLALAQAAWGGGARYGPALQAEALANTTLGPYGNEVSVRFRAAPGGVLRGVRPFLIWSFHRNGYHGGTGGILRVELRPDDGTPAHGPGRAVLAVNAERVYLVPASDQFYPLLAFDRAPTLRAGQWYHLVFSNTHPERETNFLSLNALFDRAGARPRQPRLPDEDWTLLYRNARQPAWTPRRTPGTQEAFTPILEVVYEGGASQGIGYIEAWVAAARPIGAEDQVGEAFTPARTLRVKALAVRVRRLAGQGPLRLRIEEAGGKARARAEAAVPSGGLAWARADLPEPAVLEAGTPFRLVLEAAGGDRFEAFPLRKGTDKGFGPATVFTEGHAETGRGGAWTGWTQWGRQDRKDADLQFYFEVE